ncbi:alpha/beta hydrolase [Andreprevotia chitinilytica]|uniref:alpha/beta hydrolase n=1 Tax=Andreprevotia chitinilytica TaxID=396808 RepID=UPI0005581DE9|nr:alpha/beta fold hydrolase [Andreprevotia chitinilytica]
MSGVLEVLHHPPTGVARNAAPPLLFVHGAYTGAWCWDAHFLPWFAERGFDAHAVSLRGHAGSWGRDRLDHFGIHDFVADVAEVAAGLAAPPVIIGHSFGGFVAQTLARQQSLPAMALLGSVPPYGLSGSLAHMGWSTPHLLWALGRHQFSEHPLAMRLPEPDLALMRELLFSNALDSDVIRDFAARTQPESLRALGELLLPQPWRLWKEPQLPCLVVGVDNDRIISAGDVWLTARAWHTTPRFFAETGHALMIDQGWERIATCVAEWLDATFPAA